MPSTYDLIIIGSGFSGSLLAMIARRLGRSVLMLERGRHPRFVIGESSTPLANLLLEELARRYNLPRLLPLTKWGTWQESYPKVGCGLKRGFTFYHHAFGQPWSSAPDRANELLVAASPRDGIADTHWYRPDFDHFLVREAQALGVDYLDQVDLHEPDITSPGIVVRAEHEGKARSWTARFLVDATGPRGFLHQAWGLKEQPFPHLPPTQGLFTHFSGVARLGDKRAAGAVGQTPPYPVDDAAVHHVFDGGWIWVLQFKNGITSAGVAANARLANELHFEEGAPAWARLLDRLPTVREQFAGSKPLLPFVHTPQLSFRSATAAGWNWALLPSAAGFVDPLLSTGFPLTLLGVTRLAEIIERDWDSENFNPRLALYARQTLKELDATGELVAALYANMGNFPLFSAISLLYFAAAIYTETARRLGRPELAGPSFLLRDHAPFGRDSSECLRQALSPLTACKASALVEQIYSTIGPIDLAGLCDRSRHNWFPVEARDLFQSAQKIGATEADIQQLLARCGFKATP